ncbi:hypothetical protein BpHYR1_036908 [Brachionus plicatilis]|uniref:Uncharacterized protein n=1 Tax=Brachionus plicatilis TaxID=10195 RepID=A0A3M7RVA8_BRAPC|nr:hypothetical protein BpHYR1_036908 [Brachionus plicatilis]
MVHLLLEQFLFSEKKLNLSGLGKICEIDETMFPKVKHLKGKYLSRKSIWVFWIVKRFRELGILLNSYSIQFVHLI